jgi:hypothetical protein
LNSFSLEGEDEMSRRLIAGLFAATLLIFPLFVTAARAAESGAAQIDAYTTDFADFLGFVGGVRLDSAQRQLLATQTAADVRANSGGVRSNDETIRKLLGKLNTGDESAVAEQREKLRLQFAALPAGNVGRVVVERNDPTVVFDEKHHRIITQRSLAALRRACVWMAGILEVPGPQSNFVATTKVFISDHYDRLTDAQQETLAHTERDLPLLVWAYEKANAAKRKQFIESVRPYSRDRTELAPLTVALLGAAQSAVQTKIINDSIVLMGQMNNTMLFRAGY